MTDVTVHHKDKLHKGHGHIELVADVADHHSKIGLLHLADPGTA